MNKLDPNEIRIIQMALHTTIEDLEAGMKSKVVFNKKATDAMTDMLLCAKSAHAKISSVSGCDIRLDPYVQGDEKEFLTT